MTCLKCNASGESDTKVEKCPECGAEGASNIKFEFFGEARVRGTAANTVDTTVKTPPTQLSAGSKLEPKSTATANLNVKK